MTFDTPDSVATNPCIKYANFSISASTDQLGTGVVEGYGLDDIGMASESHLGSARC